MIAFMVSGQAFIAGNLKLYASWASESVAIPSDNHVAFIHRATIVGKIGEITGLTRMNFVKEGRNYYAGSGSILDDDENVVALNFFFERRNKKMVKRFIGKNRIQDVQDRTQFLSQYLSQFLSQPPENPP